MDEEKIKLIVVTPARKRKQLLRDLGIQDEKLIEKLAHSGRDGLQRYLRKSLSSSSTAIAALVEPSTSQVTTAPTMSSAGIPPTTRIILESVPSPTDGTTTWAIKNS